MFLDKLFKYRQKPTTHTSSEHDPRLNVPGAQAVEFVDDVDTVPSNGNQFTHTHWCLGGCQEARRSYPQR
jgi:hypothetical protein